MLKGGEHFPPSSVCVWPWYEARPTHFEVKFHSCKWDCRSGQLGQTGPDTNAIDPQCEVYLQQLGCLWYGQEIGRFDPGSGWPQRSWSGSWLPFPGHYLPGTWHVVGGFQPREGDRMYALQLLLSLPLGERYPLQEWAVHPGREHLQLLTRKAITASVTS